jgi:hypothetical protein
MEISPRTRLSPPACCGPPRSVSFAREVERLRRRPSGFDSVRRTVGRAAQVGRAPDLDARVGSREPSLRAAAFAETITASGVRHYPRPSSRRRYRRCQSTERGRVVMASFRCSSCKRYWPHEPTYRLCPDCQVPTSSSGSGDPIDSAEAASLRNHILFDKFYAARELAATQKQTLAGP